MYRKWTVSPDHTIAKSVTLSHAFYGAHCPLWGSYEEDTWHYSYAEEMDAGEALFDDIDWEAQDHSS